MRATTIGGSDTIKRFCSNAVFLRMFSLTLSVKLNIRKSTALEQKRLTVFEPPIVVQSPALYNLWLLLVIDLAGAKSEALVKIFTQTQKK